MDLAVSELYFKSCKKTQHSCFTEIELAVDFFTVDNIEPIGHTGLHIADFKVKPLMLVSDVDVWVQYQVVFVSTNLQKN